MVVPPVWYMKIYHNFSSYHATSFPFQLIFVCHYVVNVGSRIPIFCDIAILRYWYPLRYPKPNCCQIEVEAKLELSRSKISGIDFIRRIPKITIPFSQVFGKNISWRKFTKINNTELTIPPFLVFSWFVDILKNIVRIC